MKISIFLAIALLLSGCSKLYMKDMFGIAPSLVEIEAMSAVEVCQSIGAAYTRNQSQAYMEASAEATKRINGNEISDTDCRTLGMMKIKHIDESRESLDESMKSLNQDVRDSQQRMREARDRNQQIDCREAGKVVRCTRY